ncbi:MAG TPA: hypothetical protein VK842_01230 [bacterium]|nr:hypothetical protein [bacterium]
MSLAASLVLLAALAAPRPAAAALLQSDGAKAAAWIPSPSGVSAPSGGARTAARSFDSTYPPPR